MWKEAVTIETDASPEKIWVLWADVKNWNTWDPDVKESDINGEFAVGTQGTIKPTSGPKSKFEIISAEQPVEFSTRASLPLAKMIFFHHMTIENGKVQLTHGLEISGPLTFLFSRVIGRGTIANLPEAMENLVRAAKRT